MRNLIIVVLLALASSAHATGSYLGTANQDVTVTAPLPAGTNNVGTVSGSTVTSIIKDSGGEEATVTGGRLDVNATVMISTPLAVINTSRPDLTGLSLVYKSTDNMTVGGSLTLTGKANQVDLQAISNDCTFNIGGGEDINVAKNTAEAFNFDYTAVNLVVNLTAKSGGATCKVRIVGAN